MNQISSLICILINVDEQNDTHIAEYVLRTAFSFFSHQNPASH